MTEVYLVFCSREEDPVAVCATREVADAVIVREEKTLPEGSYAWAARYPVKETLE